MPINGISLTALCVHPFCMDEATWFVVCDTPDVRFRICTRHKEVTEHNAKERGEELTFVALTKGLN